MDVQLQAYLTEKFGAFLSEERKQSIEHVLNLRTKHITVVLEDLIDAHNVNAIFRSGECLGIQAYHVIDNEQRFHVGKGVCKGANKWIDIHRHDQLATDNSLLAVEHLRRAGYQIMVAAPAKQARPLNELDISKPIALVMGSENTGVSESMKAHADQLISIPMFGFTESFNVSVATAIILHQLTARMHLEGVDWALNDKEKAEYKFQWYKKCMARPDYYQNYYVNAYEPDQNV